MAQTIFSRVSLFPVLGSLVLRSLASFSTAVICPLLLLQYIHNIEREQVVPFFLVMGCYILIGTSHLHPYVPPSTKQPKPLSSSLKPGNLPFSCFTAGSSLERNDTKKIFSTLEKKLYYLVSDGKGGSDYMFCDRMLNWNNKNSKVKYLEKSSYTLT